jgi:hypothetical protein
VNARGNYESYRANKIETGLLFQDFVIDLLFQTIGLVVVQYASRLYQVHVGESRTGVEIKHDEWYASTNNLWIEVAEKARPRAGEMVPSGICRDDNSWLYVIGDYDTVFIFGKTTLLLLKDSGRYKIRENRTQTSRGFLLDDNLAQKLALYVLRPNAKEKIDTRVKDLEDLGRTLHELARKNPAQRSFFDEDED